MAQAAAISAGPRPFAGMTYCDWDGINTEGPGGASVARPKGRVRRTRPAPRRAGDLIQEKDASKTVAGRQIAVIDPLSSPTYFAYDVRGQQTALTNALGHSSYFTYDAAGQRTVNVDPRGYPTYFQYDQAGRQAAVTDALGHTAYFLYDAAGRQTVQVMPSNEAGGAATYFLYDALGRRLAVTDALGHSAYFQYDAAGQQTASVDALGYVTYYYYDDLGRQHAVRDAADGLVYYAYDALGRRTALTDQRGNTSYFGYDAASRLLSELDPLGNATYYDYDADGKLIARLNQAGGTDYFQYDATGRLTGAINPPGEVTYFDHDLRGDLIAAINPRGNPTYYAYDVLSRMTAETDAIGESSHYSYDPAGDLVLELDGEGRYTYYAYDPNRRTTHTVYQDGALAYFTYDANGRLVSMTDTWGESTVEYDAADRMIARSWPDGKAVYFEYDAEGGLTALTNPAGEAAYYQYDSRGLMKKIHVPSGSWVYYDFDGTGNVVRRQNANGTLAYFAYDAAGRPTSIRNLKGDMSPLSYFDYSYDDRGLISSIAREGGVAIYYGYDMASRLTSEVWNGPSGRLYAFSYGYDPAGNRTHKDIDGVLTYYAYDAAERLLHEVSEGATTYYGYDRNGSCTSIEKPASGEYTYFEYSDAGLIKTAHLLPADRWNYFHYDGQGTRYCIEDSEGAKYYYWDGLHLLQRDNQTTGATRTFTQGYTPIDGIGNMVQYSEAGEAHTFHFDGRGTVFDITGATQAIVQTYEHGAWGIKLSGSGNLDNPIQYQGCAWLHGYDLPEQFLSPTRVYASTQGRFEAKDPVSVLGWSGYLLTRDCPVAYVDASGRTETKVSTVLLPRKAAPGYTLAGAKPAWPVSCWACHQRPRSPGVLLPCAGGCHGNPYPPGWPQPWNSVDFVDHYFHGKGDPVRLSDTGLFDLWRSQVDSWFTEGAEATITNRALHALGGCHAVHSEKLLFGSGHFSVYTKSGTGGRRRLIDPLLDPLYSLGGSNIKYIYSCIARAHCCRFGDKKRIRLQSVTMDCSITYTLLDTFDNPLDICGAYAKGHNLQGSEPYLIWEKWTEEPHLAWQHP